jgi:hypothetical protein
MIQTGKDANLGGVEITASGARSALLSNLAADTTYNFYMVLMPNRFHPKMLPMYLGHDK